MGEYVHLIGAEEVTRASRGMSEAAESIRYSAIAMGEHVDRLIVALHEHHARMAQLAADIAEATKDRQFTGLDPNTLGFTV